MFISISTTICCDKVNILSLKWMVIKTITRERSMWLLVFFVFFLFVFLFCFLFLFSCVYDGPWNQNYKGEIIKSIQHRRFFLSIKVPARPFSPHSNMYKFCFQTNALVCGKIIKSLIITVPCFTLQIQYSIIWNLEKLNWT